VTSIEAVSTYLPERRIPIGELAGQLGLRPVEVSVFQRYHQLHEVRWDTDASLLDLLLCAVDRLDALRGRERRVRYVLHARAFPVVVPFPDNPLHELCRRRGLAHAQAFTVTQQSCATGLLAVDIAGRLLASDGDPEALALVLSGEKAFTPDAQLLPNATIFSEGAAACLVRHGGTRDRLLAYATQPRGDFDGDRADAGVGFQREYQGCLIEVMRAALDRAGVGMDEIRLILPHNVNRAFWRRLCKEIGAPLSLVFLDNVVPAGHVFCADAFLNYEAVRDRKLLRPGDRYLVAAAGAGLGATFSAMVFEH
jgi:3-oxoacyl-[acyl-carrier-protein] synthase-3